LLNKKARAAGVRNFRYFQNEGYLGMYNCTTAELKKARGLSNNQDIHDHIGTVELAANIFRITLIIERLKSIRNPSEEKAAAAHWRVGAQVRQLVKDNTGLYPEQLRKSEDLEQIQHQLKIEQRKINS
jgi:DNA-damage-inducible protein D